MLFAVLGCMVHPLRDRFVFLSIATWSRYELFFRVLCSYVWVGPIPFVMSIICSSFSSMKSLNIGDRGFLLGLFLGVESYRSEGKAWKSPAITISFSSMFISIRAVRLFSWDVYCSLDEVAW